MMSNETIADVRSELFATLRGLTDKTNPMDIDRARAVAEVAQTIINSAKVEVEHMKIAGGKGTGFIPEVKPLALPGSRPDDAHPDLVESRPGLRRLKHELK